MQRPFGYGPSPFFSSEVDGSWCQWWLKALMLVCLWTSCCSQTCLSSTQQMTELCTGTMITSNDCFVSQAHADACAIASVNRSSAALPNPAKCSEILSPWCSAAGGKVISPPVCDFLCTSFPASLSRCSEGLGKACKQAGSFLVDEAKNLSCSYSIPTLEQAQAGLPYKKLCCRDLQRAIEAGCSDIECGLLKMHMDAMRNLTSAKGGCDDAKECISAQKSTAGKCELQAAKRGAQCVTGVYKMKGLCQGLHFKSRDCYADQANANDCAQAGGEYLDSIMDPGLSVQDSSCARSMPNLCNMVGGRVSETMTCDFWCQALTSMSATASSCFDDSDCAKVDTTPVLTSATKQTVQCPKSAMPTQVAAGSKFVAGLFLSGFCCDSVADIIAKNCVSYSQDKVETRPSVPCCAALPDVSLSVAVLPGERVRKGPSTQGS